MSGGGEGGGDNWRMKKMEGIAASGVGAAVRLKLLKDEDDSNGKGGGSLNFRTRRNEEESLKLSTSSKRPQLSFSKPSFVVRTESNVRKEKIMIPNPPCVVCKGTGRVDCYHCSGKGRTNFVHLQMLPKGEWPQWCRTCGGSGLGYCSRCLGTGEYRYIMGFHFMERDSHDIPDQHMHQSPGPHTAADGLLNQD